MAPPTDKRKRDDNDDDDEGDVLTRTNTTERTTFKKSSTAAATGGTGITTMATSAAAMTVSSPNVPVHYKSDGDNVVSAVDNKEITTKPLCEEVEQFIDSWVKGLDGDQPTEAQEQHLKEFICNLDQRVQQEGIDPPNPVDNTTEHKTDGNCPVANASKPSTLLELVHYILQSFDDKELQELKFHALVVEPCCLFEFKSRVEFEEALKDVANDRIEAIFLTQNVYYKESLHKAIDHVNALLCTPNKLVEKINNCSKSFLPSDETNVIKWDKYFVKALGPTGYISFPGDSSKGSAIVVSGESGSGKTWFARKFIPQMVVGMMEKLALIYYCVQDNDGHDDIMDDESIKKHFMACQKCMNYLPNDRGEGRVYQCVNKLSMKYNKDRDRMSSKWLNDKIGIIMEQDEDTKKWWYSDSKTKYKPVDKLVVVVDDLGKNPELARGLVSMVRAIYCDVTSWRARNVLLVLVGSGLDYYIRNVIPDEDTGNKIRFFGTDPFKSIIIRLQGPDLTKDKIYGIPTSSILNGTYSRVLATNTRMLTRGILPMMKIPALAEQVLQDKIPVNYEALGSTNILMDYAVRKYVALTTGLAPFNSESVDPNSIILTQFKLLLRQGLHSIQASNPAAAKMLLDLKTEDSDFRSTLALGLITSDITSTSPALRYLACGGNTAPLDAKDGIGFEIVVQHHLVRLGELYNHLETNEKEGRGNCWVGSCNLSQAWPSFSSQMDAGLHPCDAARKRVEQFYRHCNVHDGYDLECGVHHNYDIDIVNVAEKVKNKDEFYLVMRQKVSNAQGPDIMVLYKRDGKILLELFQCKKDWQNIPGVNTKEFMVAFWSLGVTFDVGRGETIKVDPEGGSAGYNYLGVKEFADKLGAALGAKVEIGDRILVFSKSSKELDGKETDFLKQALEKGVMVWTGEMLEPTISVLYNGPTSE